jgi:hypothetical protein
MEISCVMRSDSPEDDDWEHMPGDTTIGPDTFSGVAKSGAMAFVKNEGVDNSSVGPINITTLPALHGIASDGKADPQSSVQTLGSAGRNSLPTVEPVVLLFEQARAMKQIHDDLEGRLRGHQGSDAKRTLHAVPTARTQLGTSSRRDNELTDSMEINAVAPLSLQRGLWEAELALCSSSWLCIGLVGTVLGLLLGLSFGISIGFLWMMLRRPRWASKEDVAHASFLRDTLQHNSLLSSPISACDST